MENVSGALVGSKDPKQAGAQPLYIRYAMIRPLFGNE